MLIAASLMTGMVLATPQYAADVPAGIRSPDSVKTQYLEELISVEGFPTDEATAKASDFPDTSRAVEFFLHAMPAKSMSATMHSRLCREGSGHS